MSIRFSFFCRTLLVFGVFFFFTFSFAAAQSGDDNERNRITSISITGLKRTRLSTAERPLRQFIGREAHSVDPDDVWAAVMATGILEPLSVEIEGNVLSVAVQEKWSIFPVPVAMAGSGGMMAGLAFFDANAFGLNDKFFLAGIYQTGGWSAGAGYMHASPGGRLPGLNGFAAFSREKRSDRDQRNKELRRFDLDSFSFSAGLDFPLRPDSDLLSSSLSFSYSQKSLKKNILRGPDGSLRLFGASAEISIGKSAWDGFLLSREAASIRYSLRTNFGGFSFQSIQLRGVWEKSLVPGFKLNLRTGLLYDPDAPVLFESSPFAAQVFILPQDFSARNYAGVSAGLEKYIVKFSFGTLSLAAAYQLVYSGGSILGDSLDHGVAGLLTFYLNRLAIPALGIGAAYNVKENYFQGSFSLGMSF